MATYMDALSGQHADGSEQESNKVPVVVKNIEYFSFTTTKERIAELGSVARVIDVDFNVDNAEKISEDCYEFASVGA